MPRRAPAAGIALLVHLAVPRIARADCVEGADCCPTADPELNPEIAVGGVRYTDAGLDGASLVLERVGGIKPSHDAGELVPLAISPSATPPREGQRMIAISTPVPGCNALDQRACDRVFAPFTLLDGGSRTCILSAVGQPQSFTEGEAIDLALRPDCYSALKTRSGYRAEEDLCEGMGMPVSGPCAGCETAVGWTPPFSACTPLAVGFGLASLAFLRRTRGDRRLATRDRHVKEKR